MQMCSKLFLGHLHIMYLTLACVALEVQCMLSLDTIMKFLVSVPMGTYTMVTNIVFVAGRRELSLVVKVQ